MSLYVILLIFSATFSIKKGTADSTHHKFVYQKDMSEYCQRHVMPAVFLGKQVVDANSQILHFSRLEMPYSCFITVRTEMGSNIIVVIQVVIDMDLVKSCKEGNHQLLVYEIGETFGGYWGQMPDSVMRPRKNRNDHSYTLLPRPPPPPTTTTDRTTTLTSAEPTSLRQNKKKVPAADKSAQDDGYIRIEVPILNVSADIVPGKIDMAWAFSTEDPFEKLYDVTPRAGEAYETKVVPLLEIGLKKDKDRTLYENNFNEGGSLSQFEIALNHMFTPDPRLLLPDYADHSNRIKSYKYHPNVNKRLDFKKNLFVAKGPFHTKRPSIARRRPELNTVQSSNYISKPHGVENTHTTEEVKEKSNYWDAIHDILKNLSKSSEVTTLPPHKELANILRGVSNKKFNKSVYLNPDLSYIDLNTPLPAFTEHNSKSADDQVIIHRTTHFDDANAASRNTSTAQDFSTFNMRVNDTVSTINKDNGASVALLPIALDVDSIILNITNQNKNDLHYNRSKSVSETSNGTKSAGKLGSLPVSLVDHESFENVVQSASVMAIKLNQTKVTDGKNEQKEGNERRLRRSRKRKKRYLHAIEIAGAKPHKVQVMKHVTTTATSEMFNRREYQRLIELQDDEISGRIAMQYLPRFMGQPLLDFCDFNETATKYVFLFNSSRLVLAVSNFTVKRMSVILTPSRTLVGSEARCGPSYLECQISGARVCIDSLTACDGIPNCGSYDIYDEDRLTCGAASGFRHNVCLAAITFLAVLLTVLYTIHYWLKRCVPKVSDAFFIYTDAAENVLYLDSIMKSPHDIGVSKYFFRGEPEQFIEDEKKGVKKNAYKKIINKSLMFLRLRAQKYPAEVVTENFDQLCSEKLSAFDELEIQNMSGGMAASRDTAVQTGTSLQEEPVFSPIYSNDIELLSENLGNTSTQPSDELNMLHFLRKVRARSISVQQSVNNNDIYEFLKKSAGSSANLQTKETEVRSEIYDYDDYIVDQKDTTGQPQTSNKVINSDKNNKPAVKHLRFEDEALGIPLKASDVDDEPLERSLNSRRSIILGTNKIFNIQEREESPSGAEEQPAGGGRELKSYFNWGKEKKKKKPKKK